MKRIRLRNGKYREFRNTAVMGIVNVTPDSFYADSRADSADTAFLRAEQMIRDGAAIIDVGGESTRPGAEPVEPAEESARICPVIRRLKEAYPKVLVSADTYHAETARASAEAGADIINDISGMTFDPAMAGTVAMLGIPVILMHTGGRPGDMQKNPSYEDVTTEVLAFLQERMAAAVASGIAEDRIILDPGIGFGKTYAHNLQLMRDLHVFTELNVPVLLGASRKTFIGTALDLPDPADRLNGTIAVSLFAQEKGVDIVRVHDVRENYEALKMMECLHGTDTVRAVIALGSNMGDRQNYLDRAVQEIEKRVGRITAVSDILETKAYGYTEQGDFLNMVLICETALTPHVLLDVLHEIEAELDRVRLIHWGPRTVDLDILYYGEEIIKDEDLQIPHADLANRDFVLRPLAQIAETMLDPEKKKTIGQLLAELEMRRGE